MIVVNRTTVLAELQRYLAAEHTSASLAAWAFDQFYAVEEDRASYEPGYRRVLAGVLDALMFSDDPHFQLDRTQVAQMIAEVEGASFDPAGDTDDDDDEEDEDEE